MHALAQTARNSCNAFQNQNTRCFFKTNKPIYFVLLFCLFEFLGIPFFLKMFFFSVSDVLCAISDAAHTNGCLVSQHCETIAWESVRASYRMSHDQ